MSFYNRMVKASTEIVFRSEAAVLIQKEVHLTDEVEIAGSMLDMIFREFRELAEWPDDKLKFAAPGTSNPFAFQPSDILTRTKDAAAGVTAVFLCGRKTIEDHVSWRELDSDRCELKICSETFSFSFANMPLCPPFAPGIVIAVLAAKTIMGSLENRIYD